MIKLYSIPTLASLVAANAQYNTYLITVADGFVWVGNATVDPIQAGNQGSAPLSNNVPVASARIFNEVYFVDGTSIAQLDVPTLSMETYQATAGSTPNSTIGSTTLTLASLTSTGTVATGTTSVAHGWSVGDTVVISGASPAGYDGSFTIVSTPTGTSFTYTLAGSLSSPATGTILADGPYTGNLTTCSLACTWRGRLVLAGDSGSPQNFYMSRAGVPTDWNYGATDSAAAVAGNLSTSGLIGEPITCLIPFSDDIMMIGCTRSIWLLQGDLADGGSIVPVSANVGILGANGWCKDSFDTLYFLGTDGLYKTKPLWEQYQPPQLLSGQSLDQYFQALEGSGNVFTLTWDEDRHYVHIFSTPSNNEVQGTHLVWDTRNEGLWPQQYPIMHGPTASILFYADGAVADRGVLLGGWDGKIRRLDLLAHDDDTFTIASSLTLGPFKPFTEAGLLSGVTIDFGELAPPDNGTLIVNEIPTPPADGSTTTFTLSQSADVSPAPIVRVEGALLDPSEYSITGISAFITLGGSPSTPVVNEIPTPAPNGSTTTFHVLHSFDGESTPTCTVDGTPLILGTDWIIAGTTVIVSPGGGAVNTGQVIEVSYSYGGAPIPVPDGQVIEVTYTYGENPSAWNVNVTLVSGTVAYDVTQGTPTNTALIECTLDRRQKTMRQRMRGGWFAVTISNFMHNAYFSFESAVLEFHEAGRNRRLR